MSFLLWVWNIMNKSNKRRKPSFHWGIPSCDTAFPVCVLAQALVLAQVESAPVCHLSVQFHSSPHWDFSFTERVFMELRKEVQTGTLFIKQIHRIVCFLLIFILELARVTFVSLKKKFCSNMSNLTFEKNLFLFFYEKKNTV